MLPLSSTSYGALSSDRPTTLLHIPLVLGALIECADQKTLGCTHDFGLLLAFGFLQLQRRDLQP